MSNLLPPDSAPLCVDDGFGNHSEFLGGMGSTTFGWVERADMICLVLHLYMYARREKNAKDNSSMTICYYINTFILIFTSPAITCQYDARCDALQLMLSSHFALESVGDWSHIYKRETT